MATQFMSVSANGGAAVPYQAQRANAYLTLGSSSSGSQLMKRYQEAWRFYDGIQWNFTRADGEPLVTANYVRPIVQKKVSWLVGKGMTIEVSEALREVTKPILDEVWEYNNRGRLLHDMATVGSVTGDVDILVSYEMPSDKALRINPHTGGRIRMRLLSAGQATVEHDPLNAEQITKLTVKTVLAESKAAVGRLSASKATVFIEEITADEIRTGFEGGEMTVQRNALGEIPFVHIANESRPGEYNGLSDVDGLIDLQREYNEKLTDVSDIVNYHSSPITIMIGAKAKDMDRTVGTLWSGLPKDAKVFNLAPVGDLTASNAYLSTVMRSMFDVAGIPENSLGRPQAISNTSSAALQVQFQPLIEAADRKRPNYEFGIQRLNYFILRMYQLVKNESLPVDLCKSCGGRIVTFDEKGDRGAVRKKNMRCFMIDPQTLEFLDPLDVKIKIKRKLSYGVETRAVAFREVKKMLLKDSASFWDPMPAVKKPDVGAPPIPGVPVPEKPPMAKPAPLLPGEAQPTPPPADPPELVAAGPEQLAPTDIDLPEEPETVRIRVRTWNASSATFEEEDLGELLVVPTGCSNSTYLNPYETRVTLLPALPRDGERELNKFASMQTNGWVSRKWAQAALKGLGYELNIDEVNKQLVDDVSLIQTLKGVQGAQVAQTPGFQPEGAEMGGDPTPAS